MDEPEPTYYDIMSDEQLPQKVVNPRGRRWTEAEKRSVTQESYGGVTEMSHAEIVAMG